MSVQINEVELATNLAEKATIDEILHNEANKARFPNYKKETDLIEYSEEDEMSVYKDDVQDVFNRWYDYFYGEIFKCETIFV